MKPHLPITLLSALMSSFVAQAVEIPVDYSLINIGNITSLENYLNNLTEDNLAFLLRRQIECSPSTIETWASSPLFNGGNLLFCSNNTSSPVELSFKDGNYSAFQKQGELTFDTLSNLTFSGIKGGAILSDSVSIKNVNDYVDDTIDVLFELNQSKTVGAAINTSNTIAIIDNANIAIRNNKSTSIDNIKTYVLGGAIHAGSDITISNNDDVTFSGNTASYNITANDYEAASKGGAVYSDKSLTINNNSVVIFSDNHSNSKSYSYGGAIYTKSTLAITENTAITFKGNVSTCLNETDDFYHDYNANGGAIYGEDSIIINKNRDVSFIDNKATSLKYTPYGGAIYAKSTLTIDNNTNVLFQGNSTTDNSVQYYSNATHSSGGAICAGILTICNNTVISFVDNSSSYGGAIYADNLTINDNSSIVFDNNIAHASTNNGNAVDAKGGALYSKKLVIQDNGDITFSKNHAITYSYAQGGAINSSSLTMIGNGNITFDTNTIACMGENSDECRGGAIYTYEATVINGNKNIIFKNNTTYNESVFTQKASSGGAIYTYNTLSICNNQDVTFSGNSGSDVKNMDALFAIRAQGGAIYATKAITISGNANVSLNNNFVSSSFGSTNYNPAASGGAIYAKDSIEIIGNENVLFEKNYEKLATTYRLRSIYQEGGNMTLAAKTGGEIAVYDSVYSTGAAHLNGNYTDAEGKSCTATGDIIFSGKHTETHLNEILTANNEGRTATNEEILNAQTSYIGGGISLYNGTLQVIDGAQLNGGGVAVSGQGKLLLRDAGMNHAGKVFTFNIGTTLELQGVNSISANSLTMNNGSILSVSLSDNNRETALLSLTGTLSTGSLLFNLNV